MSKTTDLITRENETYTDSRVLQVVQIDEVLYKTGTTTIPIDDTIPQNTEGTEFLSATITPKSATSKLIIEVVINFSSSAIVTVAVAVFKDSEVNAIAVSTQAVPTANYLSNMSLLKTINSVDTSPHTFKVRVGGNNASTYAMNGNGTARYMGGAMTSSIKITEVL